MGAVVAIKDNAHLGTDALVSRLSPAGKKACAVVGHLIMIYICWVMLLGSIDQTKINMGNAAPSTGLPVGIVYMAGVVFSVSAALMLLRNLWRLVTGKIRDEDLVMIQESEDTAAIAMPHAEPATPKAR
jgi:TRAP-type C4-dicarboxylate transport system permease small subunit